MAKDKSRYFTFLLYPESIPEDWKSKLELIGVPIAISPFHDMDEKTDKSKWTPDDVIRNGKHYKKPHYHVVYVAKNPVTADSVRYKIKQLLGDRSIAKVQIVIRSMASMYSYLHIKIPFFFRITQGIENKNNFSGLSGLRSEERRVGKECRIGCRSRWSPYH